MKHGDQFIYSDGDGHTNIHTLYNVGKFWVLLCGEGRQWISPYKITTPIAAFGGDHWHDRFRKIPKLTFEWVTFNSHDSSDDFLYVGHDGSWVPAFKEYKTEDENEIRKMFYDSLPKQFASLPRII